MQLKIGLCFSKVHIHPTMGMAFAKVVTDRWLCDDLDGPLPTLLPLMSMPMEKGLGMLSLGNQF